MLVGIRANLVVIRSDKMDGFLKSAYYVGCGDSFELPDSQKRVPNLFQIDFDPTQKVGFFD